MGLILLAEQALLGLSAEIELELEERNCWEGNSYWREEGQDVGVVVEVCNLGPFQHWDHNTNFGIVDFLETMAMGRIVVGE